MITHRNAPFGAASSLAAAATGAARLIPVGGLGAEAGVE